MDTPFVKPTGRKATVISWSYPSRSVLLSTSISSQTSPCQHAGLGCEDFDRTALLSLQPSSELAKQFMKRLPIFSTVIRLSTLMSQMGRMVMRLQHPASPCVTQRMRTSSLRIIKCSCCYSDSRGQEWERMEARLRAQPVKKDLLRASNIFSHRGNQRFHYNISKGFDISISTSYSSLPREPLLLVTAHRPQRLSLRKLKEICFVIIYIDWSKAWRRIIKLPYEIWISVSVSMEFPTTMLEPTLKRLCIANH